MARPKVEEWIAAAIAQIERRLPPSGKGERIIRSISEKQKPRRKASQEYGAYPASAPLAGGVSFSLPAPS